MDASAGGDGGEAVNQGACESGWLKGILTEKDDRRGTGEFMVKFGLEGGNEALY